MIRSEDMDRLCVELEQLRDRHVQHTLAEVEVWSSLDRVSQMLEEGRGGEHEELLAIIHSLLSAIWSNVRASDDLAAIGDEHLER